MSATPDSRDSFIGLSLPLQADEAQALSQRMAGLKQQLDDGLTQDGRVHFASATLLPEGGPGTQRCLFVELCIDPGVKPEDLLRPLVAAQPGLWRQLADPLGRRMPAHGDEQAWVLAQLRSGLGRGYGFVGLPDRSLALQRDEQAFLQRLRQRPERDAASLRQVAPGLGLPPPAPRRFARRLQVWARLPYWALSTPPILALLLTAAIGLLATLAMLPVLGGWALLGSDQLFSAAAFGSLRDEVRGLVSLLLLLAVLVLASLLGLRLRLLTPLLLGLSLLLLTALLAVGGLGLGLLFVVDPSYLKLLQALGLLALWGLGWFALSLLFVTVLAVVMVLALVLLPRWWGLAAPLGVGLPLGLLVWGLLSERLGWFGLGILAVLLLAALLVALLKAAFRPPQPRALGGLLGGLGLLFGLALLIGLCAGADLSKTLPWNPPPLPLLDSRWPRWPALGIGLIWGWVCTLFLLGALALAWLLRLPLRPLLRGLRRRERLPRPARREDAPSEQSPQVAQSHPAVEDHEFQQYGRCNHMISLVDLRGPRMWSALVARVVLWLLATQSAKALLEGRLADIPGIQFGHWRLLDGGRRLLFVSNFDGSFTGYLDDFIRLAPGGTTAVWYRSLLHKRLAAAPGQPAVQAPMRFPPAGLLFQRGVRHEQAFKAFARCSMLAPLYRFAAHDWLGDDLRRAQACADALHEGPSLAADDRLLRSLES